MDKMPKLTVVMPSLNRAETIGRTLEYLAKQDLDPDAFEVILIEDGNTEATRRAVEAAMPLLPYELTFMQNDGHRGPGYTENRGLRAARAPIVLLLADDVFLQPGALRAHLESHERNPEPQVAVLGQVLQSPELTQSVFLHHWDPFGFRDLGSAEEVPWYMFWACNISVKRDFLLENAMFREHRGRAADGRGSGGAAHEDVELGHRLREHGLRILYNRDAWGFHYHVYTLERAIQRYYERGINWGEFYKYVPDPELLVQNHVLAPHTLRAYVSVFRRPNSLRGSERSLAWQLVRHAIFLVLFNRVTAPLVWKPLMDRAETNPLVAKTMSRPLYRAFLYYHFLRGVREAYARYGD
jgi:GT2 family glycosyltransferase